ncbi:hypothetical protein phiPH15_gp05 [Streptococcus phage PH15]|nr:hypothetical protein phiPH15_gp05 [Streptococcus phage PH15]CAQ57800.1 hypothetical protein [Streptococcus phage PH15]
MKDFQEMALTISALEKVKENERS